MVRHKVHERMLRKYQTACLEIPGVFKFNPTSATGGV
jgi:hypothetical protein